MKSMKYILFFLVSLILQAILFFGIKRDSGITMLDMLVMSLLFSLFMFLIDRVLTKKQA
ncbi:hypothetical protein BN2127_JRS9_03947 [Bacillus subtilis]|nr:hypothetical protein BSUBE1_0550 [Bacillus subtilis E1]CUB21746.1 hypothetical protein BN2127_JRS2_03781 [Bacillus subtilis]CUB50473.1 hypothetical protein BN2127_JRS11_03920 [Bacillus subtilis]CUB59264.1 hypothetical protein BN2127_JRS9_03947 [Bacillus subtilis]